MPRQSGCRNVAGYKIPGSRKQEILAYIRSGKEMHVASLAAALNVSPQTIRRDLTALEQAGIIKRVYGGALPTALPRLAPVMERFRVNTAEKLAIARVAAGLVQQEQLVFIGSGSTNLAVAQEIAQGPRCRVTTMFTPVLEILGQAGHEVEGTGGHYDDEFKIFRGADVLRSVGERIFDLAFFSVHGIDPELGAVEMGQLQTQLQREVARRTRTYVVLATADKFGRSGNFVSVPFSVIDIVVTDRAPPKTFLDLLVASDVEVLWPGAGRPAAGDERPGRGDAG